MNRDKLNKVIELIQKIIDPGFPGIAGLECIDVEWVGNERALRVFIDGPEGVNLDTCAAVSHALNDCAELESMIPGSWNLEVSSPGLERPLRRAEHFRKFIGATVNVNLTEKISDRRHAKGKLLDVTNDERVTLETEEGPWSFPVAKLHRANIVFDWERSQTT
ncbi:ribosome maturation factor RimP [bacterium]|nr:ribosome maturation factor RimP [bacterium]